MGPRGRHSFSNVGSHLFVTTNLQVHTIRQYPACLLSPTSKAYVGLALAPILTAQACAKQSCTGGGTQSLVATPRISYIQSARSSGPISAPTPTSRRTPTRRPKTLSAHRVDEPTCTDAPTYTLTVAAQRRANAPTTISHRALSFELTRTDETMQRGQYTQNISK